MAESRDSSILFSLRGLMDVEQERVDEERRAAEERAYVEHVAEQERRRLVHEALNAQAREAERARRQEEQRQREDQVRSEARAQAELDGARVAAATEARLAVLRKQHEYGSELAAQRSSHAASHDRGLAMGGVSVALATVALSLGLWFGKVKPDTDRLHAEYDQLAHIERSRADAATTALGRAEKRRDDMTRELETTQSDLRGVKRALEEAKLAAGSDGKPAHRGAGGGSASRDAPPLQVCKDDGDPINGCLPRR